MSMFRYLSIGIAASLILVSCGPVPTPLPQGEQTVRAFVTTAPVSLKRRGTHALLRHGKIFAYAESTTVALERAVGTEVELVGIFESNIDPYDMPVFVVSQAQFQPVITLKSWSIPSLGLTMDVPLTWKGDIKAGTAEFSQSGVTLLRVTQRTTAAQGVTGDALSVGLRPARAELLTAEGRWVVRVVGSDAKPDTIFSFTVDPVTPLDMQLKLDHRILGSVRFGPPPLPTASSAGMASSVGALESAAPVTPCGGPAGVLCSQGFTCVLTPGSDSGFCRKRK